MFPCYQFRTGFISDIANGEFDLPCVWLCPIDLDEAKGRQEGTLTYSAIMYLFQSKEGVDSNMRDDIWDQMEVEARKVLADIIGKDIRDIKKISSEVDENSYTGYGELSLKLSFSIVMDFCNE